MLVSFIPFHKDHAESFSTLSADAQPSLYGIYSFKFISLPTGFLGRRLQQQECQSSCAAVGWKLKFNSYFGKSGSCEIFPSAMKPREKGFLFRYTRLVTEKKSSVFEGNSRNAYIRQGARNQQCFSHHAVYTCSEQDCTVLCFKEE